MTWFRVLFISLFLDLRAFSAACTHVYGKCPLPCQRVRCVLHSLPDHTCSKVTRAIITELLTSRMCGSRGYYSVGGQLGWEGEGGSMLGRGPGRSFISPSPSPPYPLNDRIGSPPRKIRFDSCVLSYTCIVWGLCIVYISTALFAHARGVTKKQGNAHGKRRESVLGPNLSYFLSLSQLPTAARLTIPFA